MAGAGFAVTKGARKAARIGGSLSSFDKHKANRRNRRRAKQDLLARGENADFCPKLHTDWDVI